jgi:hypothetical protein
MSRRARIIMPTEKEDREITAAALSDPDAQPLTDEQLDQFKPSTGRRRLPAATDHELLPLRKKQG